MNDVTQFVANFGHFLVDRLHSLPGIRNSLVVHFLHCFDLLLGQVLQHAVQLVSTSHDVLYPVLLHFVTIFPIFKQVILD